MQKGSLYYCDHCSKLTAQRQLTTVNLQGVDRHFCCPGCEFSWKTLKNLGYGDIYNLQRKEFGLPEDPAVIVLTPEEQKKLDDMTRQFVRGDGYIKLVYLKIEKIHCAACVFSSEEVVRRLPGVLDFSINPATHRARVRWDNRLVTLADILNTISAIGYYAYPFNPTAGKPTMEAESKDLTIRLGASAFLSMNVMLISIGLYAGFFQGIDPVMKGFLQWINLVLTIPGVFYAGKPIIEGAWQNLKSKKPGMDFLIALGTLSAFFLSTVHTITGEGETYYDTANMLIFFILLGRYVEIKVKRMVLKESDKYDEFRVESVTRLSGSVRETVAMDQVATGDELEFYPGDRIPVDGILVTGDSAFDESLLTGESVPVEKAKGDSVISGSRNLVSTVSIRVTGTGEGTVLSRVMELIEESQLTKSPLSRLVDRVSGVFIYSILILAALTGFYHHVAGTEISPFLSAVAVLVIACPCALAIATPMAILVGNGVALGKGLLIKSGDVLENLVRVNHIVFDKTGTLTTGIMRVASVRAVGDRSDTDPILASLAHAETEVYHPVAKAISSWGLDRFGQYGEYTSLESKPGRGIRFRVSNLEILAGNRQWMEEEAVAFPGSSDTEQSVPPTGQVPVFVAVNGMLQFIFQVEDSIRPEAEEAIRNLRKKGYRLSVLSGDRRENVLDLARATGLPENECFFEHSPDDKLEKIREFRRDGSHMLMVGDGVNDAPALGLADVGIAMGEGNRITLDNSGVVLLNNHLSSISRVLTLAGRTQRKIRQNLFWALVYNVIMIPLAMTGVLIPIYAAAAMSASSVSVVLNSVSLRWKS